MSAAAGAADAPVAGDRRSVLTDLIDSSSFRVALYVVAAVLALWWGVGEYRARSVHRRDLWPTYWFLTAAVLAAMALSRSVGVAELLGDVGREQARTAGWYEARRAVQALAVGAITVGWVFTVAVAILRVPPRRRRYLAHVVTLSAVVAFAAVRLISLHQVDALLYRRGIADVRFVAIIEVALLVASMVIGVVTTRTRGSGSARDSGPIPAPRVSRSLSEERSP